MPSQIVERYLELLSSHTLEDLTNEVLENITSSYLKDILHGGPSDKNGRLDHVKHLMISIS